MRAGTGVIGALLFAAACSSGRPNDASRAELRSPQGFVSDFYAWYVPLANGDQKGPAWHLVLQQRASALAPELSAALTRDTAAQSAVVGQIAGLDFDPFLNSQDPCPRYEAGDAVQQEQGYSVEVYGVCGDKRNATPDVIVELASASDSWAIVNIRYPGNETDLLAVLGRLRVSH